MKDREINWPLRGKYDVLPVGIVTVIFSCHVPGMSV